MKKRLMCLIVVLLAPPVMAAAQGRPPLSVADVSIDVIGDLKGFSLKTDVATVKERVNLLHLTLTSAKPAPPPRFTLKWRIPSHDVAGHWMTSRVLNKSIRPDWTGGRLQPTMFAKEAPVSMLFSSNNQNVLTFAVSDALNTIALGSGVREEDGFIYNGDELSAGSRLRRRQADRGALQRHRPHAGRLTSDREDRHRECVRLEAGGPVDPEGPRCLPLRDPRLQRQGPRSGGDAVAEGADRARHPCVGIDLAHGFGTCS